MPRSDRSAYLRAVRHQEWLDQHPTGNLQRIFEERMARTPKTMSRNDLQEAADAWLRRHEAKNDLAALEPAPEPGSRSWSEGPTAGIRDEAEALVRDATDHRADLIAAARAGDEHAQWRASELFGMEFAEAKRCAS